MNASECHAFITQFHDAQSNERVIADALNRRPIGNGKSALQLESRNRVHG
jgi:hypothetical protein